jgi:hypothetical protein
MSPFAMTGSHADAIDTHARSSATRMSRGSMNIEDQVRSALQLAGGLAVLGKDAESRVVFDDVDAGLGALSKKVLDMEREISVASVADPGTLRPLVALLGAITQRSPTRERTHVFTTNYDRVIEFGCDAAGIRILDRFVGGLTPVFRASRLNVDLHYNPPGIRGEPRYLEGVLRLTKLHGSLDWRYRDGVVRRVPLDFGSRSGGSPDSEVLIYPRPAKDVETLDYPYADLFRDFSAAICRPNALLVTFGYGFGDDHINRVIADMCTIASTHLLVVSFDSADGRIDSWLDRFVPQNQRTVLGGADIASLEAFVERLPAASTLPATHRLAHGAPSARPVP